EDVVRYFHLTGVQTCALPVLELHLREAYHPLLFLSNKYKKEKTYPQTIILHPENRIIVISGPNAGGKSITLKTIGLLQLMLQSEIGRATCREGLYRQSSVEAL